MICGFVLCFRTAGDPIPQVAAVLRAAPVAGLPRAVVLLPSERHAHALRRYVCVQLQEPRLLAGTMLLRPVDLAREIVVRSGQACAAGWEEIRRLRILHIFESTQLAASLRYFNLEQLRSGRGYADAFARTIGDLESSGIEFDRALDLAGELAAADESAAMRLHDVAVVWRAVDAGQRQCRSSAETLALASTILRAQPACAAPFGPCIALLASSPTTMLLRFLDAVPNASVVLQDARPLRTGTQRWRHLVPPAPADGHTPGPACASELEIVRRYLFEVPEILTDPERPRSAAIDGSVEAEEHASVEEEVEAAAAWVGEQLSHGLPAEQIAILVPDTDPYAGLVADRLARLAIEAGKTLRVHVAGGLSLAGSPAGLRVLALLRALRRGLDAESTIRILPWLRHPNEGETDSPPRLSPSKAARLVYETGIIGGGAANGVSEWVPRLTRRRDGLGSVIAAASSATSPDRKQAIDRQSAQRALKDIEHVLPAITELQNLAVGVHEGESLARVWPRLRDFCKRWLRLPPDPPNLLAILDESLAPILCDAVADSLAGRAAISMLADYLRRGRRATERFGVPCIFIAAPSQAAGLGFRAVRVMGLAEGLIPRTAHDDPILPDAARRAVEQAAIATEVDVVIPRLADRVLDEMHDVFRVIGATTEQLSLSVPRQSIDRSEREASGILLEIATALGRGNDGAGADGDVPTAARLRSAYFNAGRANREGSSAARPLSPRAALMAVPRQSEAGRVVPASWMIAGARSLERLAELQLARVSPDLNPMDGIVAAAWNRVQVPGLSRQRPVSATAVKMLIECPHRFLLERVLFLKEPARRPPTDTIDAITYGNLFHVTADRVLRAHGAALCKHDESEAHWIASARTIAAECFDERLGDLPLRGADTIARERARLLNQIEYLVRYEWRAASRNYFASELGFGEPNPIDLHVDGGSLYLRGAMDRVDQVSANAFQVRDLKTGRVHDFTEEPVNPTRDLQIGVYVLILEALKLGEDAEVSLAAYVHPSATQEPDRSFVGIELAALRRATRAWLGLAHELLRSGSFPRTPDARDCTYCQFVPVCAEGAQARSEHKLRGAAEGTTAGRFLRLKKQRGDSE